MTTSTHTYTVLGMDCADCARTVEQGVAQLKLTPDQASLIFYYP